MEDGSQIAYRSWKTDQRGIFTTPVDNVVPWSIQRKSSAEAGRPVWSPDDRVILFQSYEEPDRLPRIYYTGGDGYLPVRSDKSGLFVDIIGVDPDWMPNGSIVYTERECEKCGIFNVSLAGGVITRVTDSTGDEAPAVSPDGSRVAFMSTRNGAWDLYVVNTDGSTLTPIDQRRLRRRTARVGPRQPDTLVRFQPGRSVGHVGHRCREQSQRQVVRSGRRGWTGRFTRAPRAVGRKSASPGHRPPRHHREPMVAAAATLDTSNLEGTIAFPVFENGTYNIYTANTDGSDRQLLVEQASQPDFNADGSQIAYRSWKTDQRGLFSSPVAQLIPWNIQQRASVEAGRPTWSADGMVVPVPVLRGTGPQATHLSHRGRQLQDNHDRQERQVRRHLRDRPGLDA